jgi:cytidylate kinase
MIVTIDGPAGSGKSSAAKGLALRLGFEVLDTGAMYRAVGLAVYRAKVELSKDDNLRQLLSRIRIELPPGQILLNGEDITSAIRTPEISAMASKVAAIRSVREFLVEQQQAIAAGRDMVCEGRDQGTVVFPDAECKFFLEADRVQRAQRRWRELEQCGTETTLDSVLADQDARDQRDASRDISPMAPAPDARIIDTTRFSLEQVIDLMEQEVRQCLPS